MESARDRRLRFPLIPLVCLFIAFDSAAATEISRIVAFGDSWTAHGGNGNPWVEVMADAIGVPLSNQAHIGDTSAEILEQAEQYVNGSVDPNALYVYWNVGNDFNEPGALNDIAATAATIAGNMTTTLSLLRQTGAQHFLVMNNVDGLLIPRAISSGTTDLAHNISSLQNSTAAEALAAMGLASEQYDAEALFNQLVLDPRFVNVTQSCEDVGCSNPDQYLWWDDSHPTAETHRLIAAAVIAERGYTELDGNPDPGPDPGSAITIHSQSFEGGLSTWSNDSQNAWYASTRRASDGSRSAQVDGWANDSALTSPLIFTEGRTNVSISFDWLIESGFDFGEFIAFDVSTDGTSWTELARLRGDVSQENQWHSFNAELTGVAMLQLRFRSTVSRWNEIGDVDNVIVTAFWGEPVDEPPSIMLSEPADGSIVSGNVDISADADDDNGISQVDFYINGDLVYSDTSAPYELSWGTAAEVDGASTITVVATDTSGKSASDSVTVEVDNVNSAPVITTSPATSVLVLDAYSYDVDATDPDPSDLLTYSLQTAPAGMSINAATGFVNWTPGPGQIGGNAVTVRVSDTRGLASTQSFVVDVLDLPPTPAEIELYSAGFESGTSGWSNDGQRDWFASSQRGFGSSHSIEVDGFAWNAAISSAEIDMQGKSTATVSFAWYIESGFDSGEYIAVDVAADGGNWQERARIVGESDPEDSWQLVSFDVQASNSLKLRFRAFVSSSSEDGNVDAVTVIGR